MIALESASPLTFTISADDPRTIRALEIAAEADQWLLPSSRDAEQVFGVPSQSESGRYYLVTRSSCDCPDFRRNELAASERGDPAEVRACKHILAVRLYTELVRAQRTVPPLPARRRR